MRIDQLKAQSLADQRREGERLIAAADAGQVVWPPMKGLRQAIAEIDEESGRVMRIAGRRGAGHRMRSLAPRLRARNAAIVDAYLLRRKQRPRESQSAAFQRIATASHCSASTVRRAVLSAASRKSSI